MSPNDKHRFRITSLGLTVEGQALVRTMVENGRLDLTMVKIDAWEHSNFLMGKDVAVNMPRGGGCCFRYFTQKHGPNFIWVNSGQSRLTEFPPKWWVLGSNQIFPLKIPEKIQVYSTFVSAT